MTAPCKINPRLNFYKNISHIVPFKAANQNEVAHFNIPSIHCIYEAFSPFINFILDGYEQNGY